MARPPAVCFLYPPFYWAELDSKLLLLRAWAEARGIPTVELIRRDDQSLADLARAFREMGSVELVVFFHGWWGAEFSAQQLFAYRGLAALFKRVRPGVKIAALGDYPMYVPETYLRVMPEIDIAIRTDGYVPITDFFERGRSGADLGAVRGIVFRANGEMVRTAEAPPVTSGKKGAELDAIPSPYAMGLATPENYLGHYHTALGCPYLCAYCRTSVFEGKNMTYFSLERVLDDLGHIREVLARARRNAMAVGASIPFVAAGGLVGSSADDSVHVSFEDQTFTLDKERTRRLCRMLIDANLGISFNCYTRAHLVDKDLLELMAAAGMRMLQFGFESAEPRVLRAAGRMGVNRGLAANIPAATAGDLPLDPGDLSFKSERAYIQRVADSVRHAQQAGMKVFVSAIAGLPASNAAADQKTIDFIIGELKPDFPNINPFYFHPGVRFFEENKSAHVGKLEDALFEIEASSYDLEALDFRGATMAPTHLTTMIESVLDKLDGLGLEGVPLPAILFTDAPAAHPELERTVSSGCWQVHLGPNDDFRRVRERVAPYPYLNLYDGPDGHVGPQNWRFQVKRYDRRMRDIVTADGELDLSRFTTGRSLKVWPRGDDVYRITIEDESDVEAYARLSDSIASRGTFRLGPSLLNDRILFEDACRWARASCPAPTLFRLSLRGGRLAPCPTGATIAPLGTSNPELRETILTLGGDVAARRGCAQCDVRDRCAQCLLTGPIAEEAYCRLQKARARTGWFNFRVVNDMLGLVRSFNMLVTGDPEATVEIQARASSGVVPGPGLPGAIGRLVDAPNAAGIAERTGLARTGPGAPWNVVTTLSAAVVSDELARGIGLILDGWSGPEILARLAALDPTADAQAQLDEAAAALEQMLTA